LQEEKDLENNVSISARRYEESPFIKRHDTKKYGPRGIRRKILCSLQW
jgi:hypothetical protein